MILNHLALFFHIILIVAIITIHYSRRRYPLLPHANLLDICAIVFIAGNALMSNYHEVGTITAILLWLLAKLSTEQYKSIRYIVATIGVGLLSLALASHIVPGFERYLLIESRPLSTNHNTFNVFFSLDKALVAAVLLIYYLPYKKQAISRQWMAISLLSPLIIAGTAIALGVPLAPKIGLYLLWFLPINLFITCLAEELFFRRIIQENLINILPKTHWGTTISLLISSYLFIIAHGIITPNSAMGVLYLAAGFLYAWVYQKTRRVELSIATHFSMNTIHILFFPYPLIT